MRYEKGRKDASRNRILEVAAEQFRSSGIAASGLAGIMSGAGLTNGAFYPHFPSKGELVRESIFLAMDQQSNRLKKLVAEGGLAAMIEGYLSPWHRDNPGRGCALAALLPELARQSPEARRVYAERLSGLVRHIAAALPPAVSDREAAALGILSTLIGALQLARTVQGTVSSDRILRDGVKSALTLAKAKRPSKRKPASH
jgi:TetR/AcrR family transcriptional regulator, transcriptional repressor for nem operon